MQKQKLICSLVMILVLITPRKTLSISSTVVSTSYDTPVLCAKFLAPLPFSRVKMLLPDRLKGGQALPVLNPFKPSLNEDYERISDSDANLIFTRELLSYSCGMCRWYGDTIVTFIDGTFACFRTLEQFIAHRLESSIEQRKEAAIAKRNAESALKEAQLEHTRAKHARRRELLNDLKGFSPMLSACYDFLFGTSHAAAATPVPSLPATQPQLSNESNASKLLRWLRPPAPERPALRFWGLQFKKKS